MLAVHPDIIILALPFLCALYARVSLSWHLREYALDDYDDPSLFFVLQGYSVLYLDLVCILTMYNIWFI